MDERITHERLMKKVQKVSDDLVEIYTHMINSNVSNAQLREMTAKMVKIVVAAHSATESRLRQE